MSDPRSESTEELAHEWLTVAEVAAIVRVSEGAVRRRIASGTIAPNLLQEFDGGYRIHRSLAYPNRRKHPVGATAAPSTIPPVPEPATQPVIIPVVAIASESTAPENPTRQLTVNWKYAVASLIVATMLVWIFFSDIGSNPAGLFSDEAEIGLSTKQWLDNDFPKPILFYDHLGYHHMGALPIYASAPILAVADLSERSTRIVTAIWALLGVVMLLLAVRRLGWRHGEIGIIAFASTPVFIHLSRIQFGHGPSVFCTGAAYYAYVRAREEKSVRWAFGSGLLFGGAMYGQGSWYIASPLLLGGMVLGELIVNRLTWRSYRIPLFSVAGFAATCVPIAIKIATDDLFMKRFNEKNRPSESVPLMDKIGDVLGQYPKYFNLDYLFRVGETGMPGGWNMRHSVPGAGELTWILVPLMIAGIVGIIRASDSTTRVFGIAALVTVILYPAPDVITTTDNAPPYTVGTFSMMVGAALLAALGMHYLSTLFVHRKIGRVWSDWVLPIGVLAIVLNGAYQFFDGPYRNYPNVSAEYYGWQYGAGPAIEKFKENPGYERYVLDGDFNAAFVFLDFYMYDDPELRAQSAISWPERSNGRLRELYAVRAERYDRLMQSNDNLRRFVRLVDVIYYPNGRIAMYLIEVGHEDLWGPRPKPS